MRRSELEVKDINSILDIVKRCKSCAVAMKDSIGLYIVPLNFGYEYENDRLILYFHCARQGRKIDAIRQDNSVAFEMDTAHRLITADSACGYTYYYDSVVGSGKAFIVEDINDKIRALDAIMRHYADGRFDYSQKSLEQVCIFKIIADGFTAKSRAD